MTDTDARAASSSGAGHLTRRKLGWTGFEITPVGFGAWALGGGNWEFGWGPQNDGESLAAIRRAVDLGVNWIDTAAAYGLGHSETIVGQALREMPADRRPYVFTKCSLIWDDRGHLRHSLEPASLRRELEGSLRRLSAEAIDLYQIHWPAWQGRAVDLDAVARAWETLAAMKREGRVRHVGLSNADVSTLERCHAIAPVASVQPPYSLRRRGIEADVLPWCARHDVGVIAYSPLLSGLLSGGMTAGRAASLPADDWRRLNPEFREPRLSRNLALVERLRDIGREQGRTPAEMAIAWTLRRPVVSGAIVGWRSPRQVDESIGALRVRWDARVERAVNEALAALG